MMEKIIARDNKIQGSGIKDFYINEYNDEKERKHIIV
jgi:hypothetical protein